MSIGVFLGIHPCELKFPFQLRKQSTCSIQLTNKTDHSIAFKVKTTNPKRYSVRPNAGVVLPRSLYNVAVTMQAPKEAILDMLCKDKFMVQSVIVPAGTTTKNFTNNLFDKEDGKLVEEFRLRVIYVPANRPATVPEEEEEGNSSDDDDIRKPSDSGRSLISKMKRENASIQEHNDKLIEELELLEKQSGRRRISALFVVEILALIACGVWIGYLISKYEPERLLHVA